MWIKWHAESGESWRQQHGESHQCQNYTNHNMETQGFLCSQAFSKNQEQFLSSFETVSKQNVWMQTTVHFYRNIKVESKPVTSWWTPTYSPFPLLQVLSCSLLVLLLAPTCSHPRTSYLQSRLKVQQPVASLHRLWESPFSVLIIRKVQLVKLRIKAPTSLGTKLWRGIMHWALAVILTLTLSSNLTLNLTLRWSKICL